MYFVIEDRNCIIGRKIGGKAVRSLIARERGGAGSRGSRGRGAAHKNQKRRGVSIWRCPKVVFKSLVPSH